MFRDLGLSSYITRHSVPVLGVSIGDDNGYIHRIFRDFIYCTLIFCAVEFNYIIHQIRR